MIQDEDEDWIGPWDERITEHGRVAQAEFIMMLRSRGISDRRVLAAMEQVPRSLFVEPSFRDLAYSDRALPIDCGQTISQPYIVAYMSQQLDVAPDHRVLEVGTGSGYQTAVLAHLAAEVYSIDRYRTLVDAAENRLASLKLSNIEVKAGDGFDGWPEKAPFDRIIVTAAYRLVPPALIDQLVVGGILIMPVGPEHGVQTLVRVERTAEGTRETRLIAVRFVPMVPGQAQKL